MADVRVSCINKTPRDDTHNGITHLGGSGWHWTRQQVIASINAGSNTFYTYEDGKRANVAVVKGTGLAGDYLQTHADGKWTNNLLALPECR